MSDTVLPAEVVALARRVVEENAAAGRTIALAESSRTRPLPVLFRMSLPVTVMS